DLPPGGFLYGDPQPLPANLPTALGAASPCVAFQGCDKPEVWCPIPAAPEPPPTDNHSQWPYAAQVTWEFFAQQP
ncbi:MAG: hypothetical protein LBE15_03025, partial [Burkholderiales bacterium]|nr:hypothetical protein [Burkholderiales bacterium]